MRIFMVLLIALAPVAHADEAKDVRTFFDTYVNRANAYDATLADLYSPDARILSLRDGTKSLEVSGVQWKEMVAMALPIAEQRGEKVTFREVTITQQGEGYRVAAIRYSNIKCLEDTSYYIDVTKIEGRWQITEEYLETVSLSLCEPSKELAALIEDTAAQIRPNLPMDLDEHTRLEAVEVIGSALIYRQRLHTVTAEELDLESLAAAFEGIALQSACGSPSAKGLLDAGVTLRFAYVDRNDVTLPHADVTPGVCSLIESMAEAANTKQE